MNRHLASALVGVATLAATAFADDFAPPPYRGGPLSVYARWEFPSEPTNWLNVTPTAFSAVAGPPAYHLFGLFETHAFGDGGDWQTGPIGGITPKHGDALINFKLQNWVDDLPIKLLRIQVTWSGLKPPDIFSVVGFDPLIIPHLGELVGGGVVDDHHFYQDWKIRPNPDWDLITLKVKEGSVLHEVVIDTISIPAPGAFTLAGLASLIVAPRRRR
ncbi:MAG: hypothetical protein KF691_13155 [Phycisphaeraceae bacterium]|nr:hypothetical protein [Phycisphaeraceae bacterium]